MASASVASLAALQFTYISTTAASVAALAALILGLRLCDRVASGRHLRYQRTEPSAGRRFQSLQQSLQPSGTGVDKCRHPPGSLFSHEALDALDALDAAKVAKVAKEAKTAKTALALDVETLTRIRDSEPTVAPFSKDGP